jgi:hypothetical protein
MVPIPLLPLETPPLQASTFSFVSSCHVQRNSLSPSPENHHHHIEQSPSALASLSRSPCHTPPPSSPLPTPPPVAPCIMQPSQSLTLTDYHPYISSGASVKVYMGTRVAVVVDAAATIGSSSLQTYLNQAEGTRPGVIAQVVGALERLRAKYDVVVGRVPPVDPTRVDGRLGGRVPVEVSRLTNAAGEWCALELGARVTV